jgi:threonine/homoserine/homoserine lactone efflux protein
MLLITFLLTAIFISLSGVMMPGPVLTSAIVEGYSDRYAGTKIAVGHAFIEFPIMFAIFFGLGYVFTYAWVKAVTGMGGGILLIFLGWKMIELRRKGGRGEGGAAQSLDSGSICVCVKPVFLFMVGNSWCISHNKGS